MTTTPGDSAIGDVRGRRPGRPGIDRRRRRAWSSLGLLRDLGCSVSAPGPGTGAGRRSRFALLRRDRCARLATSRPAGAAIGHGLLIVRRRRRLVRLSASRSWRRRWLGGHRPRVASSRSSSGPAAGDHARRDRPARLLQGTLFLAAIPLILGALAGVHRASAPASSTSRSRASCCSARSPARVAASTAQPLASASIAGMLAGALIGVAARRVRDQVPGQPGRSLGVVLNVLRARPDQLPLRQAAHRRTGTAYNEPPATSRRSRSRCSATSRSSGRCCSTATSSST